MSTVCCVREYGTAVEFRVEVASHQNSPTADEKDPHRTGTPSGAMSTYNTPAATRSASGLPGDPMRSRFCQCTCTDLSGWLPPAFCALGALAGEPRTAPSNCGATSGPAAEEEPAGHERNIADDHRLAKPAIVATIEGVRIRLCLAVDPHADGGAALRRREEVWSSTCPCLLTSTASALSEAATYRALRVGLMLSIPPCCSSSPRRKLPLMRRFSIPPAQFPGSRLLVASRRAVDSPGSFRGSPMTMQLLSLAMQKGV